MRAQSLWIRLLLFLFFGSARIVSGQTTEDEVRASLIGKQLFLRGLWGEDKLSFDAAGQPARLYAKVPFTEAGIDIEKVKLKGGTLHLEGRRIGLEFGPNGAISRVPLESKSYSGHVTVDIAASPSGFGPALEVIFASDLASLSPLLPSYWQTYASKYFLPSSPQTLESTDIVPPHSNKTFLDTDRPTDSSGVPVTSAPVHDVEPKAMHVGGSIQPPRLLQSVDPEFTEAARALKYSANVQVYFWVNEDGSASHLTIARPAGLGLDERALAAVAKYKFSPATRNGKPVKVDLYVDVNFQIF